MKRNKSCSVNTNRRKLIKNIGTAVAASPLFYMMETRVQFGGGPGNPPGGVSGSDPDTDPSGTSEWASGGTAALLVNFPPSDPFASGLGNMCTVTSSYTQGPCYFSPDEYRQDISEGELGVPMALVLKLVNSNSQPIAGADIDIWYCNSDGLYSGNTANSSDAGSFNTGFCTNNDSAALASRWFRGVQTTNNQGLVYFKTCFPGWYRGRTSHIHFKIIQNGNQSLGSQFCFDDDLSNDIYLNNQDYTGVAKDTSNANDNVFGSNYVEYEMVVEKASDNSMLAYKAIQLS